MNLFVLLGIAIGLAMDAFAVALAGGVILGNVTGRQFFRFTFHFGLFQAMMPVLGWLAGNTAHHLIAPIDHWIAFGLLAGVGGRALYGALWEGETGRFRQSDPTRGMSLVILSIATSIDALAVGISLAMVQVSIIVAALVIGVTAALFTGVGMIVGARVGDRLGNRMEILGGLILIGMGVKILISG